MDINMKILSEIEDKLWDYNVSKESLLSSLSLKGNLDVQKEVYENVIKEIMTRHNKEELYQLLIQLLNIEHNTRNLEVWYRDHVVHSLQTFILGIFINNKLLDDSVNPFSWKLASLFHDIGYPLQISSDINRRFVSRISEIKKQIGITEVNNITISINFQGLEKLHNNKDALEYIQARINKFGLKINAREQYETMQKEGKICHGIISSLALLNIIDSMYQKYNPKREKKYLPIQNSDWNQDNFEGEVLDACTAIFIHNLPKDQFSNSKIDIQKAPIVYLLKLCDGLQEWNRIGSEKRESYSAEKFKIEFDKEKIDLISEIPENKKEKMRAELNEYLLNPFVKII